MQLQPITPVFMFLNIACALFFSVQYYFVGVLLLTSQSK